MARSWLLLLLPACSFSVHKVDVTALEDLSIAGREDRPASPDRYEISSVEKLNGKPDVGPAG